MSNKSILDYFKTKIKKSNDYKHRSLILNIDTDQSNHFKFKLFNQGQEIISGISRLENSSDLSSRIKKYIDDIRNASESLKHEDILQIQSQLSLFTDDLLPQEIRDYFVMNKEQYYYIVIEDDGIDIHIPYGILMFPDKTAKNCISQYGFFLSEYFTIVRSKQTNDSLLLISNIVTLSSDDLPGSKKEEEELRLYFDGLKPGILIPISDKSHLEKILKDIDPNCFHFCCHGTENCEIASLKNAKHEFIDMNFFNLHRFPNNTLVFFNICFSAHTKYDNKIPRSIANKFIDRNTGLVIMTEWPISDDFAYLIGTEFYRQIMNNKTALQAIHSLKRNTKNLEDKFTAITYSLKGNPNLSVEV